MIRGLLVVPALVLSLAVSTSAQDKDPDDKDQAFKAGLDARDKGNWRQVADLMRQAIAARGTESTEKVKRGLERFRPGAGTEYTPHYFLAEALWRLEDCAGAMDEWWRSEQQNVVQKTERMAGMKTGYAACEKRGLLRSPKFEQAVAATDDDISKVAAAADAMSGRAKSSGDLFNAERRAQLDEAAALLREARGKVESGKKTRMATELVDAGGAARKASGILVLLAGGLEAEIAARGAALNELLGLERAIDDASAIDGSIEPKRAFLTDALVARRQQGREALGRARRIAEALRANTSGNPASLSDGRREASSARGQFQQVFDEAQELERKDRVARSASELRLARQKFTFLDRGFKSFDSRAAARTDTDPKLIAQRQSLARRTRTALNRLEGAAKAGDSAALSAAGKTADQIGAELERLNLTFGPLTIVDRGVPAPLARASELLFSGNFSAALAALPPEGELPPDMPLLEHVYLIRAAARYELSLRGGAAGSADLADAKAALAELRSLNPGFEPNPRFFSPKFLAFFRGSRTATEAVADAPPAPGNP